MKTLSPERTPNLERRTTNHEPRTTNHEPPTDRYHSSSHANSTHPRGRHRQGRHGRGAQGPDRRRRPVRPATRVRAPALECGLLPRIAGDDPAGRLRLPAVVRRHLHRGARRSARARQPPCARHPARHALRARPLRQLPARASARRASLSAEGPRPGRRQLRRLSREHRGHVRRHRRALQGRHRRRDGDPGRAQHLQGRPSHRPPRLRVRRRRAA